MFQLAHQSQNWFFQFRSINNNSLAKKNKINECFVCTILPCFIFCRRNRLNAPRQQLAYSISGTPSTVRTTSKSSGSTKQMLPSTRTMSSQLLYRDSNKHITKYIHSPYCVDRWCSVGTFYIETIFYFLEKDMRIDLESTSMYHYLSQY